MISLYYQPASQIQNDSKMWAGIFVAIGAIPLIFNTLQSLMFTIAGENLTERIRKMTFHVSYLNILANINRLFYVRISPGSIRKRIQLEF